MDPSVEVAQGRKIVDLIKRAKNIVFLCKCYVSNHDSKHLWMKFLVTVLELMRAALMRKEETSFIDNLIAPLLEVAQGRFNQKSKKIIF
jgi:hypothetical protein